MKTIRLTKDKVAKVDDEDFGYLSLHRWYANESLSQKFYARNGKLGLMHRMISKAKAGEEVDHINGDSLDNRKENLRVVTHNQNLFNKKKYRNNKSGYKGVYWQKEKNSWRTMLAINGIRTHIGSYRNLTDAVAAYNEKATEIYGQYARLNT